MKTIKYLFTLLFVSVCTVQNVWADDVIANVSLKEKNSLSTEILAIEGIDDIKTVTHLTVTTQEGVQLGAEDWTTMKSMTALVELDLSNASADAVPARQFGGHSNLTIVKLPKDLTSIGQGAFVNAGKLITVVVPNTVTSIEEDAFSWCSNLENCDISGCNLTTIPAQCFNYCEKLKSFIIPSSVKDILSNAFYYCRNFTSPLPEGIQNIGWHAFNYASMQDVDVVIPEWMYVNEDIFTGTNIRSIELPTTFNRPDHRFCSWCNNLQKMVLKSPTVVNTDYVDIISNASNVTLEVPSHLVASYKSHPKWSMFKDAIAISPAVSEYAVRSDLNLSNSSMRMEGTPSVFFPEDASLTIAGSAPQAFNNFTASANIPSRTYTKVYNEEADVTVCGDYNQRFYVNNYYWSFLCLPFDFTVGDVTAEDGQFVIRTYNGARRNTENVAFGNWSANLTDDAVVTAGTGFILHTSKSTWVTFKAKADGTSYVFKKNTDELKIALAANNANGEASAANTGWNMVGNPWQTYYNIHKMNYTAPFAVCKVYNNNWWRYDIYSPADDDYALSPFEALFVQCPNGVTTIDFPATGRQMTSEITSQNAVKRRSTAGNRLLLDIQVASDELNDKTRLVVNDDATMDYEIGRDASKFFADGTAVPQIYSLGADGTQYAINERPAENGTLSLGILFASDGEYTLSAIRNDIGQVFLKDNETGITTDLSKRSYTFDADAGTCDGRFTLNFNAPTSIQTMSNGETTEKGIYTLDGVKLGNSTNGLKKGVYVVRQGQHTQKVIIK